MQGIRGRILQKYEKNGPDIGMFTNLMQFYT